MPRPIHRWGRGSTARKIVTHDKYSFYNPKQHPMFDKDGGRFIFFEGTYTTTFSGNPIPTPRYDYNQVMYQLDLSDPAAGFAGGDLRGSVEAPAPRLDWCQTDSAGSRDGARRVASRFRADRPGIASLPVYEQFDVRRAVKPFRSQPRTAHLNPLVRGPLFFRPSRRREGLAAATVPSTNTVRREWPARLCRRSRGRAQTPGRDGHARLLGRVWRNPSRSRLW